MIIWKNFFFSTFLFLGSLFVLHFHFFCFNCVHRRRRWMSHPKKTLCQRANEHRHDTELKWHFEIFRRNVKHRKELNLFRLTRTQHHNSFRSIFRIFQSVATITQFSLLRNGKMNFKNELNFVAASMVVYVCHLTVIYKEFSRIIIRRRRRRRQRHRQWRKEI